MRILISGSSGFVAQNLIKRILHTQICNSIILVDKKTTNIEYSEDLSRTPVFDIPVISDRLPRGIDDKKIDAVICLAGATSVDAALTNPVEALKDNISIATDLAEWARDFNPKAKILYISSDEVLGPSEIPLSEDAPLKPSQPYAVSKATAELIIHNYRDVYNLNVCTLRSCNLVGKGQKPPKLIPNTVKAIVHQQPIPIHGTGNQCREWMDVNDFCEAIIYLLLQDVKPQIYQATSGIKLSVNEVVDIIGKQLSIQYSKCNIPDRLVQDKCYAMNPLRLNRLGWNIKTHPIMAIKNATKEMYNEMNDLKGKEN
jgi:dTDP-glucose 4,6-dehydratase